MIPVSRLLDALPEFHLISPANGDPAVSAVCHDSRQVSPGAAFVAIRGLNADGYRFVPQALAAGAALVVVERGREAGLTGADSAAAVVAVEDTREALAALAAAFHGYPARRMLMAGITGTNGKTTTTCMTAAVLEAAGFATGFLSTAVVGFRGNSLPNDTHMTSPDPVELQQTLRRMLDAGARAAVVECSSHGIDQRRVDACDFDVAAITNLDSDHLDYHRSWEAYREAKGQLFARCLPAGATKGIEKTAVLNADDPSFEFYSSHVRTAMLSYGMGGAADVRAVDISLEGWESRFRLETPAGKVQVHLRVPGEFNIANGLAAAACGLALGATPAGIAEGLHSFTAVPGRMERLDVGHGVTAVVDYAHNPHALRNTLSFLREVSDGRVITVFGCTGDRDPGRRPAMGRIAGEMADFTVVTTEDTWTEDPEQIMEGIRQGLEEVRRIEHEGYECVPDRREAIRRALGAARPGDTVLLAGMGHQQSMIVAGEKMPWSDRGILEEMATPPEARDSA
jgi:UDP-N-acetylmuramoyl-L-alanyl-D-glutamate--2,6-diaminopimelate ligase